MQRRTLLRSAAALPLASPAIAQGTKPLRFVPQANLSALDPVWTTAIVVYNHAYMVYDTLYGIDASGAFRPQMCAGHELSSDELSWTFTLRDGLRFHDGEPVLARDCAASLRRWASRDAVGMVLLGALEDIEVLDDKRFRVRLKRRFRQLLFGLSTRQCFMMPERVAKLPGTEQLKEPIGSGPFRFLRDEWVSGVRAAYAKFDKYIPRNEPPSVYAGGKHVHFDRVEWIVQPDPATAIAALQKNEVDWIEQPLIDLVPTLKKSPGVKVEIVEKNGYIIFMVINHLHPPFSYPGVRQALWHVLDQNALLSGTIGDQKEYGYAPCGFFNPNSRMASKVGLERLTGPRDVAAAKKLVAESGYKGEPCLLMAPPDQPTFSQITPIMRDMLESIGINVDYRVMDWGSVIAKRNSQLSVDQGGWSAFISIAGSLTASTPGSNQPLRGTGKTAWFGWPTDPRMEELREAWFDAPDLASQQSISAAVQLRAFEAVPYVPLGVLLQPCAFRSDIADVVSTPFPAFWGVRRV